MKQGLAIFSPGLTYLAQTSLILTEISPATASQVLDNSDVLPLPGSLCFNAQFKLLYKMAIFSLYLPVVWSYIIGHQISML